MLVRNLMTAAPITVPRQTSAADAWRQMTDMRRQHLLVTDGNLLVGIVTDRDVRLNLPSPATSLSASVLNYLLQRVTVDQVMTAPVLTIDPSADARQAARIMLDRQIGALPVLEGMRIVGIVTETDVVRAFALSRDANAELAVAGR